jgi:TIR domain/Sad1 / UNC-like C-terminal
MSDIFISYARADKDRAEHLAEAFSRQGWSVWWDREIPPGKSFDETIENALNSARCIIVLWSRDSVSSRWVKTEAAEGAERGILVPALIDKVQIPLEFKRIEAADLSDWQGDSPHSEFDQLLKTVASILGAGAPIQTLTNTNLRSRRWWKTMPGVLAATAGVITAVAGLIVVLYQPRLFDGKEKQLAQTQNRTGSTPFKTEALPVLPKAAPPAMEQQARPIAKPTPSTQSQSSPINLLSPENGGQIIVATNDQWRYAIDGDENNWRYIDAVPFGGWAVYGFADDRPAIFDTFKVLILAEASINLKDFELLAGNDSPTGKFESIGKFQTQNIRFFKNPFQEFKFPAVKARYLKVKVISSYGFSSVAVYEFQLLGVLDR